MILHFKKLMWKMRSVHVNSIFYWTDTSYLDTFWFRCLLLPLGLKLILLGLFLMKLFIEYVLQLTISRIKDR